MRRPAFHVRKERKSKYGSTDGASIMAATPAVFPLANFLSLLAASAAAAADPGAGPRGTAGAVGL